MPLDTKSKHNFSVASGPDFETPGMATQPVTYMTEGTDGEEMGHVAGCHVADLGGSMGEGCAKNLLDIIKGLNMGVKLDVLLRLNAHGSWGG